jgi:hypothetical protein
VAGNTYRFITRAHADGAGGTDYSAWFFAPETGVWKYIATWKRPATANSYLTGVYSFLENFIDTNGYQERSADYGNQWARTNAGSWTEITTARFTGDATAANAQRMDLRRRPAQQPLLPAQRRLLQQLRDDQPELHPPGHRHAARRRPQRAAAAVITSLQETLMFKPLSCALLLACAGAAHANLIESFDDVAGLAAKGFILRNASTPAGTNAFFQGNSRVFGAQDGAPGAYLGANYQSAAAGGSIDDWLISPEFSTTSRGTISFYVRAAADAGFVDSFQYGLSTGGTGAADFVLGALTAADTGDWTRYSLDFAGTGAAGSVGRFAFRYTGPADSANYIGIDTLGIDTLPLPEPASFALLGLGLAGVAASRRRVKRA